MGYLQEDDKTITTDYIKDNAHSSKVEWILNQIYINISKLYIDTSSIQWGK